MSQFTFPTTLPLGEVDYITFSHRKYQPNQKNIVTGGNITKNSAEPPASGNTIALYMPTSTPASNNAQGWSDSGQKFSGPIGLIRKAAGSALVNANKIDTSGSLGDMARQAVGDSTAGQVLFAGLAEVGGVVAGVTANQLMSISKGQINNPNVEMMYDGPKLRAFSFNFIFIPYNTSDTSSVNNIIKEFKLYSTPNLDGEDKRMLGVPHLWNINYQGKAAPYMNKFKPCVLTNFVVQENGGDPYHSTFYDGAPTSTSIQLRFEETQIITREDHEESDGLRGF